MKRSDIVHAWAKIREIDNTIPDEVLDFMKDSAISALEKEELYTEEQVYRAMIVIVQEKVTEISIKDVSRLLHYIKGLVNLTNNLMFQRKPK